MTLLRTRRRHAIAFVLVLSAAAVCAHAARERISPVHVKAVFSRDSSIKPWSAFIHSADGRRAYRLFFHEERDVRGTLLGVGLVLDDGRYSRSDLNLLSPKGNWHGLHAYNFVGSDFLNGVDKSGFGPHRTIKVEEKGIVIQIDVLDVVVSPTSGGETEVDSVTLTVSVDNLNS